jgi:predicted Zn-dependent protease
MNELMAPVVMFPGQGPESAYRTAHDLLSRRFPREALELIEPVLADAGPDEKQHQTGLRTLQAWAYLQRAQLQKAEEVLRGLVADDPSDPWAQHALGRSLERQSKYAEALGPLRLAAVMSDEYDYQAAAYRVEQHLARSTG